MQLRKFEVENFRGFKDRFTFDLTHIYDYDFHTELIQNGIVQKGLIYGKNGSGKTNLGLALFDITLLFLHTPIKEEYLSGYTNLETDSSIAYFHYEFYDNGKTYDYTYGKKCWNQLAYENLSIDGKLYFSYDYEHKEVLLPSSYSFSSLKKDISFLSYLKEDPLITPLLSFIQNMVWLNFSSFPNDKRDIKDPIFTVDDVIFQLHKEKEFESFLKENGFSYQLIMKEENEHHVLYVHFPKEDIPFSSIASSGMESLYLYFYLSLRLKEVSFLFLDEFDAYYHFKTAEKLAKLIFERKDLQVFMISHHTYLLKNAFTRPDCCFLLSNGHIRSLSDSTDKEIQEAHNLEKMYRNGAFEE